MEIEYASEKVKSQCTNLKNAKKFFGGNSLLAISLLARINALNEAECITDIIVQKQFRFHNLKKKNGKDLSGYFVIDVKTKKEPWRIIMQPLDEMRVPYDPCNIHEIAGAIKVVKIIEVSKHYE